MNRVRERQRAVTWEWREMEEKNIYGTLKGNGNWVFAGKRLGFYTTLHKRKAKKKKVIFN